MIRVLGLETSAFLRIHDQTTYELYMYLLGWLFICDLIFPVLCFWFTFSFVVSAGRKMVIEQILHMLSEYCTLKACTFLCNQQDYTTGCLQAWAGKMYFINFHSHTILIAQNLYLDWWAGSDIFRVSSSVINRLILHIYTLLAWGFRDFYIFEAVVLNTIKIS